ncbi:hypothetical protein TNCT_447551 [Trichonephila clavata]|uniref:Uncharacterized protein n=1 Tax=Trichonephila clavata TaxID=2740835 RepID=A0A8X6LPL9_TRICU|nr:hypothetical protein TNCT_447551 [Trichonephila clavata]
MKPGNERSCKALTLMSPAIINGVTDITSLCVFHSQINFPNVNINSIAISEAIDVAIYGTPTALRLDDDDNTSDDVVAICLRLAVLQ